MNWAVWATYQANWVKHCCRSNHPFLNQCQLQLNRHHDFSVLMQHFLLICMSPSQKKHVLCQHLYVFFLSSWCPRYLLLNHLCSSFLKPALPGMHHNIRNQIMMNWHVKITLCPPGANNLTAEWSLPPCAEDRLEKTLAPVGWSICVPAAWWQRGTLGTLGELFNCWCNNNASYRKKIWKGEKS